MKAILSKGGADIRPVLCPLKLSYCRGISGRSDITCEHFGGVVVDEGTTYYEGAGVDVNCKAPITEEEKKISLGENIQKLEAAYNALVALDGVTLNFALHKHVRELVERLPESIQEQKEELSAPPPGAGGEE